MLIKIESPEVYLSLLYREKIQEDIFFCLNYPAGQ